jgi:hypothetical protein
VPADGEAGAIAVVLGAVVVGLVVALVVVLDVEDSDPLSLEPQAVSALMAITAAIPAVTGRRKAIRWSVMVSLDSVYGAAAQPFPGRDVVTHSEAI